MSIVIIAEKKDVAVAIARALTYSYKEHPGYFDGGKGLLITWAKGHLLTIMEPGEMNTEWEDWSWETLPIIPDKLSLKPIKGEEEQLAIINRLTKDCKLIVNAMDAGVEGELIFYYISQYLGWKNKSIKRLWTVSLQPNAIQKAYMDLKDGAAYVTLQNAGLARSSSDYILGINGSRSLSLAGGGKTLPIGRLLASILSLVYERDKARSDFVPEEYFSLSGFFEHDEFHIKAIYKGDRITEVDKVHEITGAVQNQSGTLEYEDSDKYTPPPLLLNSTDVSVIANQRFGMKPTDTMKVLQSLYLKKMITYPRTSSRYVTQNEFPFMRATYLFLTTVYPNLKKGGDVDRLQLNNNRIFSEKHLSDHHAILPEIAADEELTDQEKDIYHLIIERFFLQFQAPMKSIHRKVNITIGGHTFQTSYKKIVASGWKGLELNFNHDFIEDLEDELMEEVVDELPAFNKEGSVKNIALEAKAKKTSPPAQYTEGTLLKQLENISNLIKEPKYKKILSDCGIGTSSTRAETIKKLQDIGYIASEKRKLKMTPVGNTVIELLRQSKTNVLTSPILTAMWELELEEIRNGKDAAAFHEAVINFTINFIEEMQEIALGDDTKATFHTLCPHCSHPIKQSEKVYYCSNDNEKCSFFIYKKQYNKTISQKMLEDLVTKGETNILMFTTKDKSRKYRARFTMPPSFDKGRLHISYV